MNLNGLIYKEKDVAKYKKEQKKIAKTSSKETICLDAENKEVLANKKAKKKHSGWRIFFNVLFWLVLSIILVFQVTTLIDRYSGYNLSFAGYRGSVISSSSMSIVDESNKDRLEGLTDQYQKGDIVITKDVKRFDDFEVNDVVTYYNGKSLICHRVTDKVIKDDGTYHFITQGDKNNTSDGLIPFSAMRGKVVASIPKVGWASLYLQSPYGLLAVSSVALIVVVTLIILEFQKDDTKEIEDEKKI